MTILVISPDYVSHYNPLSAVSTAWSNRGDRVVVASGPGLAERIMHSGFEHRELVLGPGSNPGLLRLKDQSPGEDDHMARFFAATKRGMLATLRYQGEARLHDQLWRPREVGDRIAAILEDVKPDLVISDQLSFNATAALLAMEQPFASFVPGHPSSLPIDGDPYGFPAIRPRLFQAASDKGLSELALLCTAVRERFTEEFNRALSQMNSSAKPVSDGFAATSPDLVLFNYPERLLAQPRLPSNRSCFLGSALRSELLSEEVDAFLGEGPSHLPTVYVSLGSFLSAREDVLAGLVEALEPLPLRVLLASGVAEPKRFGELPSHWFVRPYFPQVAVIPRCDLVICHGGNNTVTEALTAGVPLIVGPFSSDQFAVAADIERAEVGAVFDPNRFTSKNMAELIEYTLHNEPAKMAAQFGCELRGNPGPLKALKACLRCFVGM